MDFRSLYGPFDPSSNARAEISLDDYSLCKSPRRPRPFIGGGSADLCRK